MKKTSTLFSLLIVSALLSFNVQALTLKIATLAPAGTTWMKEMKKGAQVIKEKTNGRVKIKFYPGGVMGNDKSVHRKIRINQLQGGAFSSSGITHVNSAIQAFSLPMMFKSFEEVDYVRSKMDDKIKQAMADSGFIILGISEGGFARIMSSKPVSTLEQIRDTKVWIPEGDAQVQKTFDTMGIVPIALPISDVFTGLQTGLIETITSTSTGAIAFQWHTKIKNMVETPVIYVIGVLAISKKAFDKMKPEHQNIVVDEMNKVFKRLDKINREDNINATAALKTQGVSVITPSEQEVQYWKDFSKTAVDAMVSSGSIEKSIVDEVKQHLREFRNQ